MLQVIHTLSSQEDHLALLAFATRLVEKQQALEALVRLDHKLSTQENHLGLLAFPACLVEKQQAASTTAPTAAAQALLGALGPAVVADAQSNGRQHQEADEVTTEAADVAADPA